MFRQLVLIFLTIFLVACKKHDEQYFLSNPQAIEETLKSCVDAELSQLSCQKLKNIAAEMNSLVYDLQINPQTFGMKLLKLQTELGAQKALLASNPEQENLIQAIKKLEEQLTLRLAIVRWLESPES